MPESFNERFRNAAMPTEGATVRWVTCSALVKRDGAKMSKDDSDTYVRVSIDDLMANHKKYLACPGCGAELKKDPETGRYICGDCDSDWEPWEVLDSNF